MSNTRLQGAVYGLAAMGLYCLYDVTIKFLGPSYSPMQVLFCAGLIFVPLILAQLGLSKNRSLRPALPGWTALRVVISLLNATIGAYATKNTAVDVKLMAISGLIGFIIVTCKFNSSALILGLVLGVICESNLRRAYTIANGNNLFEVTLNVLSRPVTAIIMIICVLVLVHPVVKPHLAKLKKSKATV